MQRISSNSHEGERACPPCEIPRGSRRELADPVGGYIRVVDEQLVLVTGPVGSGKTTIAKLLASRARSRGMTAAALDMDDFVLMFNGPDWRSVSSKEWSAARSAAAAAVDAYFIAGAQLVAIAGPFFGRGDRDELVAQLSSNPSTLVVALRVGLEEAIRRAASDPTRTLSKDPELLARLERTIAWHELRKDALQLSTENILPEEVARQIEERIHGMV